MNATVLGILLIAVLLALQQLMKREPITMQVVWEAVRQPLTLVEDSEVEAQMDMPKSIRIVNDQVGFSYWRTLKPNGDLVETIDCYATGYAGGLMVTFKDGKIIAWSRNQISLRPERNPQETYQSSEVLKAVREVFSVGVLREES